MCAHKSEFDFFEQEFIELVGQFQSLTCSETHLREALRKEATRAEALEVARDTAERAAADVRASAAAVAAGAAVATNALASKQEELVAVQTRLDIAERERTLLQEKCSSLTNQINSMERELQKLRQLQVNQANLQRQYSELQERIQNTTSEARGEASRLENELRRVERCANGGSEVRERARLAAAAHARERRLNAAEMQHFMRQLTAAHTELSRFEVTVAELRQTLSDSRQKHINTGVESKSENIEEVRAALEAERAGSARLEKALAAAIADNAALAAQLRANDNIEGETIGASPTQTSSICTSICPIDSFLAD